MSSQKGFTQTLVLFIFVAIIGAFLLGKVSTNTPFTPTVSPTPKPSVSLYPECNNFYCWIKGGSSMAGYGSIEGYYTTYQIKDSNGKTLDCPGLKVRMADNDPTFRNLNASKPADDVVYINLDASPQYKQSILKSTNNRAITLHIVQKDFGGHGVGGCGSADYIIYDAQLAR